MCFEKHTVCGELSSTSVTLMLGRGVCIDSTLGVRGERLGASLGGVTRPGSGCQARRGAARQQPCAGRIEGRGRLESLQQLRLSAGGWVLQA